MQAQTGRRWLLAVVAIGAGLRLAHVLALRSTPWFEHLVVDPEFYDAWAQRIAAGDWLGDRVFYMDPLYPYFLAVVYRVFGRDLLVARLFNVGFSAAACACVARLGERIGGSTLGLLCALGLALYKPDVFYVGEIDKTSLSICLVAATLALAAGRSPAARLGAGITLGLAALTRANLLVFVPFGALAFLLLPDGRRVRIATVPKALTVAGAFVAGVALVLLPVAWRNHHVGGEWTLTTAQAGQNYYTGNNFSNPYGAYGVVPFVRSNPHFEEADFRTEAEARLGRPLSASEVSTFWFHEARNHIQAHPGFAARATLRKLALFWNDFEISDSQDQYLMERESPVLRLPLLTFGIVAALALLGAVVGRPRGPLALLTAAVAVYCITVVVFFIFSRYRIQVVPALLPLAAVGAVELMRRLRSGALVPTATAIVVVAAGAWFSFHTIGFFSRDHPAVVEMRLRHLADIYLTANEPERAIATLHEVVTNCPDGCPSALGDLFQVYLRTGRLTEGTAYFQRLVAARPEENDAPRYLAELRAALTAPTPPASH